MKASTIKVQHCEGIHNEGTTLWRHPQWRYYNVKASHNEGTTVWRHHTMKVQQCEGITQWRYNSVKASHNEGIQNKGTIAVLCLHSVLLSLCDTFTVLYLHSVLPFQCWIITVFFTVVFTFTVMLYFVPRQRPLHTVCPYRCRLQEDWPTNLGQPTKEQNGTH